MTDISDKECLDKAIEFLVGLEFDTPCDFLNDTDDDCYELCCFDSPVKECWLRYFYQLAIQDREKQKNEQEDI